jgi:hypothetical protein
MHRHEISLGKILGIPLFKRQSIQRCYPATTPQLIVEFAFWDNALTEARHDISGM